MAARTRLLIAFVLVVALLGALSATGPVPRTSLSTGTTVTVFDEADTTLGTVNVTVADTPQERYVGLSETEALAADQGMLFVFASQEPRAFVMRDMAFPIDMVFVDANGTITAVHHAPVEKDDTLTRYTGTAQWVLEVPYGWTDAHDVSAGDRIDIHVVTSASGTANASAAN